jgi:hypothetical protein
MNDVIHATSCPICGIGVPEDALADHMAQNHARFTGADSPEARHLRKPDLINHPTHYNQGTIEPIDVIEDWKLNFHLGQVIKYVARHEHKGAPLADLRKALWYLERAVSNLEEAEDETHPKGS